MAIDTSNPLWDTYFQLLDTAMELAGKIPKDRKYQAVTIEEMTGSGMAYERVWNWPYGNEYRMMVPASQVKAIKAAGLLGVTQIKVDVGLAVNTSVFVR